MKERYERCLDLYLCPRSIKQRITIDRNALLPELPNINELRPFPTTQSLEFDFQVAACGRSTWTRRGSIWRRAAMESSVGERGGGDAK